MEELLEITEILCDGYRGSVCGCEECPLFDWDKVPNFDLYEDCPFQQIKNKIMLDKKIIDNAENV